MPARVVLPAAVPDLRHCRRPAPSAGVRSSARRLREARRAGRPWRVSTSGAVRRAAFASTRSGEGVPVVAVGLRSRHRKPRCVCGETAPSRSTSERRVDRTIGLPPHIVGAVSWETVRRGASRPATLRRWAGRPANPPRLGAVPLVTSRRWTETGQPARPARRRLATRPSPTASSPATAETRLPTAALPSASPGLPPPPNAPGTSLGKAGAIRATPATGGGASRTTSSPASANGPSWTPGAPGVRERTIGARAAGRFAARPPAVQPAPAVRGGGWPARQPNPLA